MLKQFKKLIENIFRSLVEEYGFRIKWHNEDHFSVGKGDVLIDIRISDPREKELLTVFYDISQEPYKKYVPQYMKAFRDPKRFATEFANLISEDSLRSGKEIYTSDLIDSVDMLLNWFPELLTGSFKEFNQGHEYDEFVKELERMTLGPLQKLDYMDPIRIKDRNCDFTWIDDLKERLNKVS